MHDRTFEYLFSGVHNGARKAWTLPYDEIRYLLADLPNGLPNPNIHAYGHRDLATEEALWPTSLSLVRS